MELEDDIKDVWSEFLGGEWLAMQGNTEALRKLAALTAGTLQTLASQIDLLHSELASNGIDLDD
ncbi:MAG: hypothetical protein WA614_03125 [Acidimicrobiales bacterium]